MRTHAHGLSPPCRAAATWPSLSLTMVSAFLAGLTAPALVPPMSWVDTVAPQAPSIYHFAGNKFKNPEDFTLFAKANDANETEVVKSYAIYFSPTYTSLGAAPVDVIAAGDVKSFQFNFLQSQIPDGWSNCFIAVSSIDKENNESKLSNIVQLTRTHEGWVIVK